MWWRFIGGKGKSCLNMECCRIFSREARIPNFSDNEMGVLFHIGQYVLWMGRVFKRPEKWQILDSGF